MLLYGFPGDILGYIRGFYLINRGLLEVFFPNQLVFIYFLKLPTLLLGEIYGLNLALFLMFVLGFVSIYFLVAKKVSKSSAVLAAFSYTTSAFFLWHAMQNPEIILAASLLPLYFWSLLSLEEAIRVGSARYSFVQSSLSAILFTLSFFSSFYVGYFLIIFTVGFFVFERFWSWKVEGVPILERKVVLAYLSLSFGVFLLTLPAGLSLLYPSGDFAQIEGLRRVLGRNTLLDLVAYAARPWDYLLPSIYHPVFGSLVRNFYGYLRNNFSYQFWSTSLPERANFLTVTSIALAIYAVFTTAKNLVLPQEKKLVLSLVWLTALMFLISLPAIVTLKGWVIPLPSYFLFKVFPMFRVYARAGVFVLLTVSFLSAWGLKFLLGKIKEDRSLVRLGGISLPFRKSVLLVTVVCGLVLFENLNSPPFSVMDLSQTPQVYRWLQDQRGNFLIAEYPRDNSLIDLSGGCPSWLGDGIVRDYNHAYEEFYQTIHGKEVLDFESLTEAEKRISADLEKPESFVILKRQGVSFVLVHSKDPLIGVHPWPYPQENPLDECWRRRTMKKPEKVYEGFKKVADFDDGVVYKVE